MAAAATALPLALWQRAQPFPRLRAPPRASTPQRPPPGLALRPAALQRGLVRAVPASEVVTEAVCVKTLDLATMAARDQDFTAEFRLEPRPGGARGGEGWRGGAGAEGGRWRGGLPEVPHAHAGAPAMLVCARLAQRMVGPRLLPASAGTAAHLGS